MNDLNEVTNLEKLLNELLLDGTCGACQDSHCLDRACGFAVVLERLGYTVKILTDNTLKVSS